MSEPARVSGLYRGMVAHTRLRPRRHHLRYRIFMMLLDLDELPMLAARCRLFSLDRFNLISLYQRDHGNGSAAPLSEQVTALLRTSDARWDGGPVRILCMPRILGKAFNPITVYFCHNRDGGLSTLLYEVNNTFGERHTYVVPVADAARHTECIRQECEKRFFVSPFMAMTMAYRFAVRRPGQTVTLAIEGRDAEGPLIATSFTGRRTEICDASLLAAFGRFPMLAAKVVLGIHWEALRLWLKGMVLHAHPPPPAEPVTRATLRS